MSKFLEELEEFMDNEEGSLELPSEKVVELNDSDINEFIRRIKYYKNQIESTNTQADAEIKKYTDTINNFRESKNSRAEERIEHYSKIVEDYVATKLKGKKKKSMDFAFGKVKFTKQQPKYNYEDKEIMNCLKTNGYDNYIKVETKESVNKMALKKALTINDDGTAYLGGLEITGIKVENREDNMTIE